MLFLDIKEDDEVYKIRYFQMDENEVEIPDVNFSIVNELGKDLIISSNAIMHELFYQLSDPLIAVYDYRTISLINRIFKDKKEFSSSDFLVAKDLYDWCKINTNRDYLDVDIEDVILVSGLDTGYNRMKFTMEVYNLVYRKVKDIYENSRFSSDIIIDDSLKDRTCHIIDCYSVDNLEFIHNITLKPMDYILIIFKKYSNKLFSVDDVQYLLNNNEKIEFLNNDSLDIDSIILMYLLKNNDFNMHYRIYSKNTSLQALERVREMCEIDLKVLDTNITDEIDKAVNISILSDFDDEDI